MATTLVKRLRLVHVHTACEADKFAEEMLGLHERQFASRVEAIRFLESAWNSTRVRHRLRCCSPRIEIERIKDCSDLEAGYP